MSLIASFYGPFSSIFGNIKLMEGFNERLCAMESHFWLKKLSLYLNVVASPTKEKFENKEDPD